MLSDLWVTGISGGRIRGVWRACWGSNWRAVSSGSASADDPLRLSRSRSSRSRNFWRRGDAKSERWLFAPERLLLRLHSREKEALWHDPAHAARKESLRRWADLGCRARKLPSLHKWRDGVRLRTSFARLKPGHHPGRRIRVRPIRPTASVRLFDPLGQALSG